MDGSRVLKWLTRPAERRTRLEDGERGAQQSGALSKPQSTRQPPSPARAGLEASAQAWRRSILALQALAQGEGRPSAEELGEIGQLAEYGFAQNPSVLLGRAALALVRVFQERYEEARDLLVGTDLGGVRRPEEREYSLCVRAMAEIGLGDLGQARRLVVAARRDGGPGSALLRLVELVLTRTEARRDAAKDAEKNGSGDGAAAGAASEPAKPTVSEAAVGAAEAAAPQA